MGLFSKFKSSMNGGVQVHVQAPSAVPSNQVIPVVVSITSESSQTINSVKAEIKAQAREEGFSMNGGVGVQEGRSMAQTVSQAENREPITIGPGETKTVNLQLYLNGGAASTGGPLGQLGNAGGALGGVLQTVANMAQNFDHVNYLYSVHASVDVQGHSLNPSDKQSIQILPPAGSNQPSQQVENFSGQQPGGQSVAPMPVPASQPQPTQPTGQNPAPPVA